MVEDGEAFVEDGAAGEGEAVLGQVAEGHSLGAGEGAVVERFDTCEHLEESGLAGAVTADQASAFVWRDQPVRIFKQ
jgi:hypothetical protein